MSAAAEPTVGFAVDQPGRIEPLPTGLENDLSPALTAHTKKTVRAALKLIDDRDHGGARPLAREGDPPPYERTLAVEARLKRAERWLSAR